VLQNYLHYENTLLSGIGVKLKIPTNGKKRMSGSNTREVGRMCVKCVQVGSETLTVKNVTELLLQ
jgi:hypothetical protein